MKKPFYRILYVQVLIAVAIGILLGHYYPSLGVDMKPLGDGFIKLIRMLIGPIIFCTVVIGIAGMADLRKVGRVGGKALIYFEVMSTLALIIGLFAAHLLQPGHGFNIDPSTLDTKSIVNYAAQAKEQSVSEFLLHIIPHTITDAFAKGDILQILFSALLFGG